MTIKNPDGTITSADLCRLIGVSKMTLSRLASDGIVQRVGHGRYALVDSLHGYFRYLRERADKAQLKAETVKALRFEKTRLAGEQANSWALKNAQFRRDFVRQVDVAHTWNTMAADIKAGLGALPDRIKRRLPHLDATCIAALAAEVADALTILDNGNPRFEPTDKSAGGD